VREREVAACSLFEAGAIAGEGPKLVRARGGEGDSQSAAAVEKAASAKRTASQELEWVVPSELKERESDESIRDLGEKPGTDKNMFSGLR
jgi:hypothetical protein